MQLFFVPPIFKYIFSIVLATLLGHIAVQYEGTLLMLKLKILS